MKVDCLVKIDAHTLIKLGIDNDTPPIDGCVDRRTIPEITSSNDPQDPIKIFQARPRGGTPRNPNLSHATVLTGKMMGIW